MAQLKDLLVQGPSRFIGDMVGTNLQIDKLLVKTSASATEYGGGTSGQALLTDGTKVYWGNVLHSDYSLNAAVGAGTAGRIAYYTANTAIGALSATIGNGAKPIFLQDGAPTALTSTVGNGAQPVYLNGGAISALTSTVGTNLKPVYLNGGTITVGAYELKATVNSGVTNQLAYYSGGNAVSGIALGAASTVLYTPTANAKPEWQVALAPISIAGTTLTYKVAGATRAITLPSIASGGVWGSSTRFVTEDTSGYTTIGRYLRFYPSSAATSLGITLDAGTSTTGRIFTFGSKAGEFVTHTAATAQGSSTNPVYVMSDGSVSAIAYSLQATVGTGTANHLTYYTGTNTIGSLSSTIGSTTKPIFIDSGIPKIMSSTNGVGGIDTPIYLNPSGTLVPSSTTKGSEFKGMWIDNGQFKSTSVSIYSGTQNRLAYYSVSTGVSSATSLYADNSSVTVGSGVAPSGPAGTIFQVVGHSVMKDIYPEITETYNLGSDSYRWNKGYFTTGISVGATNYGDDPGGNDGSGVWISIDGGISITKAEYPFINFYSVNDGENTILKRNDDHYSAEMFIPNSHSSGTGLLTFIEDCSQTGSSTQPVYANSYGQITATSYSLKATVNSGTQYGVAYYSGTNAISCITPASSAYKGLIGQGTTGAPIWRAVTILDPANSIPLVPASTSINTLAPGVYRIADTAAANSIEGSPLGTENTSGGRLVVQGGYSTADDHRYKWQFYYGMANTAFFRSASTTNGVWSEWKRYVHTSASGLSTNQLAICDGVAGITYKPAISCGNDYSIKISTDSNVTMSYDLQNDKYYISFHNASSGNRGIYQAAHGQGTNTWLLYWPNNGYEATFTAGGVYTSTYFKTGNYGSAAPTSATPNNGNGSLYFQYA